MLPEALQDLQTGFSGRRVLDQPLHTSDAFVSAERGNDVGITVPDLALHQLHRTVGQIVQRITIEYRHIHIV